MNLLFRLAFGAAETAIQTAARRLLRAGLLLGLALVFLVFALTALAVAAFIALARLTDPLIAALILAGATLLLALILLLLARRHLRRRDKILTEVEASLQKTLAEAEDSTLLSHLILAVLSGFLLTGR